jgi:hypothetical protein
MKFEDINLNESYTRTIFGGNFFYLWKYGDDDYFRKIDPLNKYKVNEYGFRSFDFFGKSDILIGGCSQTFGVGVPADAVWWKVLSSSLQETASSIAKPGAPIHWIIENIYTYFKEYGHPKKVFCLFPDLNRLPMIVDGQLLSNLSLGGYIEFDERENRGLCTGYAYGEKERPKYIKKPYDINEVLTEENSAYFSIRAIRQLEQYCKVANIELLWSTWDPKFALIADQLNYDKTLGFNNYFSLGAHGCNFYVKKLINNKTYKQVIVKNLDEFDVCRFEHEGVECSCSLDCHSDIRNLYGEENFYLGTDIANSNKEFAHYGTHVQAHIAEAFLKALKISQKRMLG